MTLRFFMTVKKQEELYGTSTIFNDPEKAHKIDLREKNFKIYT